MTAVARPRPCARLHARLDDAPCRGHDRDRLDRPDGDLRRRFAFAVLGLAPRRSRSLKAAVGYASQLQFLAMSINIGLTIAISATLFARARRRRPAARAPPCRLRPGDRRRRGDGDRRRRCSSFATKRSGMLLHANGRTASVASGFLAITLPANVPLRFGHGAVGRAARGRRRAARDVCDARRRAHHRVHRSRC